MIKEANLWNSKKLIETPFWEEKDPSTTASWIKEVKESGKHQKKPARVVVSILESKTDRHKEARPFIRQKVPPVNNYWIKSAEAPVDLGLAKPKATAEDWAKAAEDTHNGWAAFDAAQKGSDHWESITESSSEWGKTMLQQMIWEDGDKQEKVRLRARIQGMCLIVLYKIHPN
ncbi:hypothetical protein G6F36_015558 [Rhizopus arrhizus]|nr:hypothetical protein G6F36_015558 [Rhizopus arrhizus]